jgi:hypothetical protein
MTIDPAKIQPPAAHDFATFLTRLPKAELHVHVVGAIRPTTLAEFAAYRGVALPRSIETLYSALQGLLVLWQGWRKYCFLFSWSSSSFPWWRDWPGDERAYEVSITRAPRGRT